MAKRKPVPAPSEGFDDVVALIRAARTQAAAAVNTTLIDLYWRIGEHLSGRIAAGDWGDGTVAKLSTHIQKHQPGVAGFSVKNLWRMRQFYETYSATPIVSALLRQLTWTNNMLILSRSKREEEREFYLRTAVRERWTSRELERQFNAALFERVVLSPTKLSAPATETHPDAAALFRDSYMLEFLQLPAQHGEKELQRGLIAHLKKFMLELGRDFCFIGSEYTVQVGGRDFALDLLFFNRALNALALDVAGARGRVPHPPARQGAARSETARVPPARADRPGRRTTARGDPFQTEEAALTAPPPRRPSAHPVYNDGYPPPRTHTCDRATSNPNSWTTPRCPSPSTAGRSQGWRA